MGKNKSTTELQRSKISLDRHQQQQQQQHPFHRRRSWPPFTGAESAEGIFVTRKHDPEEEDEDEDEQEPFIANDKRKQKHRRKGTSHPRQSDEKKDNKRKKIVRQGRVECENCCNNNDSGVCTADVAAAVVAAPILVVANNNNNNNGLGIGGPAGLARLGGGFGGGGLGLGGAAARRRRIASIFQHYYPEGGWGYVVLVCATLAQMVAHGVQASWGMTAPYVMGRFHVAEFPDVGKI